MDRQRNRRIFAGFYRRYDGKYIYVVAVVSDADTDEKVVIFHYGTEACSSKYYTMTKKSFCGQVEVNGEWVDKFTRQPQVKITDTHISNLEEAGFPGPIRKKQSKDAEELLYENRTYRRTETYTDDAKDICKNYKSDVRK